MWIDVKIPYEPNNKLADAYNRAMENTTAPWVLLLDQDVFLCNPHWYTICLQVIEKLKNTDVGLISCMTSGPKQKKIQKVECDDTDSINYHIDIAERQYRKHGLFAKEINTPITGFFMLVKKEAWEKVKFVNQGSGVNNIDTDFSWRMLDQYSTYLIPGLYIYHRRGLRKLKWQ